MKPNGESQRNLFMFVLHVGEYTFVSSSEVFQRSDQDSGMRTSDTRKYNKVAEAEMGSPPGSDSNVR